MSFFKNLFSKGEAFVPTPTQNIPDLEPIIVQAIENLYPNIDDQKRAFDYALEYTQGRKNATLGMLALLSYSKGKIDQLPDSKLRSIYQFWMDEIAPIFPKMKDAEAWVRSISKPQV